MTDGTVTEETVEAVRRRIGIPTRHRQRFHNELCSGDSFRHFAQGYGDDNPLFCDADYAKSSCWDELIAPPMYPISAGRLRNVEWTEAEAAAMGGGDPWPALVSTCAANGGYSSNRCVPARRFSGSNPSSTPS